MAFLTTRRTLIATAAALAMTTALSAPVSAQDVTLTYMTDNAPNTVATAEAMIAAFEAANPDINIEYRDRAPAVPTATTSSRPVSRPAR